MKLRPILILLLFLVAAGVLVWLYATATRERNEPGASPWAETLTDLDACCRRKHVKSVQYDHFATIAADEKLHAAERLFRAMALSERLQENNCANVIVRLGGHYTPPSKVVVFRGTTKSNLARSIDYERRMIAVRHGQEIDRAMENGNRYAARALVWAAAGNLRHVVLMEQCSENENNDTVYLVCPSCGNLYDAYYSDPYCPLCLTSGHKFVRFE